MAPIVLRDVRVSAAERAPKTSPFPFINRARGLNYLLTLAAPGAVLLFLASELDASDTQIAVAVLIALAPLSLMLIVQSVTWRAYLRANDRTPSGADAYEWRIDSDGIRVSSPSLQISAPWSGSVDVREADDVFHFVLTPTLVLALPKQVLGETELAELRAVIVTSKASGDIQGIPD